MTRESYLLLAFCLLLGAPTWLLVPHQVSYVSPELSVGLRFLIAGLVLEGVRQVRGEESAPLNHTDMALISLQGIFLYSINFWLCYESSKYMATGLIAATVSTMIIPNMFFGMIFLKNQIKSHSVLGALFGVAGVFFLFRHDILNIHQGLGALQGFALAFLSTFLSVAGTIFAGKVLKRKIPLIFATSRAMLVGGLFSVCFAFFKDGNISIPFTFDFIAPLLYLGLAVTTIVNLLYSRLVGEVGAGNASFLWILMPSVCLVMSTLFEGYEWTVYSTAGVLFITLGGVLGTFGFGVVQKTTIQKPTLREAG